ncbi:MAG: outer membrane protein transport protein [Chthoniobacteraceae bacterium]
MRIRVILAALALLPSTGFSLGFRLFDQDAFATGRGEAVTATADNPSTIFFNPAGITQLDSFTAEISGYGLNFPVYVKDSSGNEYRSNNNLHALGQVYLTARIKDTPVTLGLGSYSPWGLSINYPDDTTFRNLSVKGSITFETVNPVVAVQLTRSLSVAVGLTLNYAQSMLQEGVHMVGDNYKFSGSGEALGFNAGLMWQPDEHNSFGIRYQGATPITFSGHSRFSLNSAEKHAISAGNKQIAAANAAIKQIKAAYGAYGTAVVDSILTSNGLPTEEIPALQSNYPQQDADAKIMFPEIVTVGYSFRPTKDWNLEADVDWTNWDSLGVVTQHNQDGSKVELPFNYNSSFVYSFGITRYFKYGLHLSGGYIYSEATVPTKYYSPAVPDGRRHIFSVGVGQDLGNYTWDLAYQFTYAPTRTIDNGTAADGSYQFSSHALSLSFGLHF